jgi:hypothetical protein
MYQERLGKFPKYTYGRIYCDECANGGAVPFEDVELTFAKGVSCGFKRQQAPWVWSPVGMDNVSGNEVCCGCSRTLLEAGDKHLSEVTEGWGKPTLEDSIAGSCAEGSKPIMVPWLVPDIEVTL